MNVVYTRGAHRPETPHPGLLMQTRRRDLMDAGVIEDAKSARRRAHRPA